MHRELLLLGLLRQQDMHGYQLAEFIQRDMALCVDLKKPTAYFLLDKLAAAGWVAQSEARAGNRPARQVYTLTPEGEAAFQRLLRERLAAYTPVRFEGDVALAFLDSLSPAEARSLLIERRAALAAERESVRAVPPHRGSGQIVVEHQIAHLEAELAFLDGLIARLEAAGEDPSPQSTPGPPS